MSSVFVLRQKDAVHMMTDGVSYTAEGIVMATNLAKANVLPTLNAAMSCTGPAIFRPLIADRIALEFESFDDLIERGSEWLCDVYQEMADERRSGDACSSVYLIGWHEQQNRPAAYAIDLWSDGSSMVSHIIANNGSDFDADAAMARRGILVEQRTIGGTPLPGEELLDQSRFILRSVDEYDAEMDLLHVTEIARHEFIDGAYWVGGKALLTSIDAKGITQRVVHHWAEDQAGLPIQPLPIADWKAWRAARNLATSGVSLDGLSRLQRERMEKKARKGTLRSVS